MKGFLIAATKSGSGKTTITLGLLAALMKRGLKVTPFKVGPDFIDPGHHTRVTGRVSRNLDGWMLSRSYNRKCFTETPSGTDMVVVEGVMGLFDGYDGTSEAGSSSQMAKWLDLPVILVVDCKSMARSAAALLQGFERFDPGLKFAGVVFNRLGSGRHLTYLKDAIRDHVDMPCLGGLYRNDDITIPERHLGLVTRDDHPLTSEMIDHLARFVESGIDIDHLIDSLPDISSPTTAPARQQGMPERKVRIGVARDNAFCFYYEDNLELLAANGAELVFFSPMADSTLPPELDGLYFGGGYPELFAGRLADNTEIRLQISRWAELGMPVYGECGGFMYLCRDITDVDGRKYPMTGCFPLSTRMFSRLKSLGYREVTLGAHTILGPVGKTIRGHEFHYSDLAGPVGSVETNYQVSTRVGMKKKAEGYQNRRCLGSYIHLHFGSYPDAAAHFTAACADFQQKRRLDET
jgi:cobyrinic acid a,c-diamide synthase